jgi:hypothetical protein
MRIRVWNAFASNNSGSYTIVGTFESAEKAQAIAGELRAVVEAHAKWMTQKGEKPRPSPFETFVKENALAWREGLAENDDWPWYDEPNIPSVVAVEQQLVVYVDYTVTMPRSFGELIYARGGRVDVELVHSHSPLVALFELWVPWQERQARDLPREVQALIDALAEGALAHASLRIAPVWKFDESWGHLTLGVVFNDLPAGFRAVDEAARAHQFSVRLRLQEPLDGEHDPLAALRPSTPPPRSGLWEVALVERGDAPEELIRRLGALRALSRDEARALLDAAPTVIARDLFAGPAAQLAGELTVGGARAEARRTG